MIEIKTFTFVYDDIEDRMKLIVNYQDFETRVDFMITRSFILKLLPSLDEFYLKHYPQDNFEENAISISPVSTPANHKTDNSSIKLMEKTPELLFKVNLSYSKEKVTILTLIGRENTVAKAALTKELFNVLLKSFDHNIPKAEWGIFKLI